jgi:signal transduction histidine kinase
VEEFLALARAENGAVADQARVEVGELVAAALAARRASIVAKRIALEAAVAEAVVIGNETLLSRMVENVIDNAIRHNEEGGSIRVDARAVAERARLLVESDGPRLDENVVRELAQPFRRAGFERTDARNGFGLGLSIVAAIASAHGGTLELSAREQGGLRVMIDIPRAPATSAAEGGSA